MWECLVLFPSGFHTPYGAFVGIGLTLHVATVLNTRRPLYFAMTRLGADGFFHHGRDKIPTRPCSPKVSRHENMSLSSISPLSIAISRLSSRTIHKHMVAPEHLRHGVGGVPAVSLFLMKLQFEVCLFTLARGDEVSHVSPRLVAQKNKRCE